MRPAVQKRLGVVLNLDLVRVHARVGDEDLDVLQPLGLVHADLLVQQEPCADRATAQEPITEQSSPPTSRGLTFVQVGVGEAAPQLLDDVDGLQVPGALQPHDGVNRQLGEVVLVMSQQFGGQRGAGDVQQVLLETSRVVATETGEDGRHLAVELRLINTESCLQVNSPVVGGGLLQSLSGRLSGLPPAGDDGLRVDLPGDEKLRLLRQEVARVKEQKHQETVGRRVAEFTRSSSAASTVTEVVPSPTSSS